tara:strand:+ start:43904 stop:44599 length:696 start_codon:yes stop_codon:yes gene_type:complete
MITTKNLQIIDTAQTLYDAFNDFILSDDTKVFGKLLARAILLDRVKDVPGDIIECGVFKGTGVVSFLKIKKYLCPNSHKKVIGFDFFDTDGLLKSLSNQDQEAMSALFKDRGFEHEQGFVSYLKQSIESFGFQEHEFELVQGDISKTIKEYISDKPGLKISLLYIDLDIEKPTYDVLCATWDRMSKGGMIVFDEYAYHCWSESIGVDRFFKDKNVVVRSLNFMGPTAYVIK